MAKKNKVIVKSLDPADPNRHETVEPLNMYASDGMLYCVFDHDDFGGAKDERWIPWHQVLDARSWDE
jgi:hypothetical protein